MLFEFDYYYDAFPSEISMFFTAQFKSARPNVSIKWVTPDGRDSPHRPDCAPERIVPVSRTVVSRRLGGVLPEKGLFADPNDPSKVNKGTYQVVVEGLVLRKAQPLTDHSSSTGKSTASPVLTTGVGTSWLLSVGTPVALAFGPWQQWVVVDHHDSGCRSSMVWRLGRLRYPPDQ